MLPLRLDLGLSVKELLSGTTASSFVLSLAGDGVVIWVVETLFAVVEAWVVTSVLWVMKAG